MDAVVELRSVRVAQSLCLHSGGTAQRSDCSAVLVRSCRAAPRSVCASFGLSSGRVAQRQSCAAFVLRRCRDAGGLSAQHSSYMAVEMCRGWTAQGLCCRADELRCHRASQRSICALDDLCSGQLRRVRPAQWLGMAAVGLLSGRAALLSKCAADDLGRGRSAQWSSCVAFELRSVRYEQRFNCAAFGLRTGMTAHAYGCVDCLRVY